MKLWLAILISVTLLVTLTRYVVGSKKDSYKYFFNSTIGRSITLGFLFATLSSLVIYWWDFYEFVYRAIW